LEVCFEPAFEIVAPVEPLLPFVFSTPHSGRDYPEAFVSTTRLDRLSLRRSEDCLVDVLFAGAPALGAPLLKAHFPRAYLDVNREPYELDPRMFEGRLPSFANTRSMRVAGGLGSIPRIVGDGQEIYRERLTVADAMHRIDTIYRPFHRALRTMMQQTHRRFGEAILFDCHSMPSASLGADLAQRPDIVLGDRYGTSCAPVLVDAVQTAFEEQGYSVVRNRPYAGGFITEHYGQPSASIHVLQIEINRSLYMNEETLEPLPGFTAFADSMSAMIGRTRQLLTDAADSWRQAAE
jgi:N-formylglutamate amidohydrolase